MPFPPPRRTRASPPAPAASAAAAGDPKRRPPERSEALLSSSWPLATPKRPPARRGLGPPPPPPPGPARAPSQAAPGRAGTPATCAVPRRAGCAPCRAGAGPGVSGPDDDAAVRFSLSLGPEALLLIQRRHLEKQLLARPRRPPFPAPPADPRRPQVSGPRARATGLRRGGAACAPDAPLAPSLARRPLLPGGLQTPVPGPRPADLRPVLKVSLLNDRHKYDDVEYEEEPDVLDEGLVRKCTEWLRGVESASATRDRTGHLNSLPHLSTL